MRLDHVSYVASHDQISDVVNRIGSQIRTAFVDGGIHPKFGTRNFTAPLLNGQYLEIVCPINHPATENSLFGRHVQNKANEGGGWLFWVIAVEDINPIAKSLNTEIEPGLRRKPNGNELNWQQVSLLNSTNFGTDPYFIKWINGTHPSKDGVPSAKIELIHLPSSIQNKTIYSEVFKNYEIADKLANNLNDVVLTQDSFSVQFAVGQQTVLIK